MDTKAPFNLLRIPYVCPEEIKKLKVGPLLHVPLSYLLQEDVGLQHSICGNIQEGSMLKYHVGLLIHINVNNKNKTENLIYYE